MVRATIAIITTIAISITLVACQAPPSTGESRVDLVGPTQRQLHVGSSLQLSVIVTGSNTATTWTTSDESVASVTSTGLVTAHAPGTVLIHVASAVEPTVRANVSITVTAAPAVLGVSIEPAGDQGLLVGQTASLSAVVDTVGGVDTGVAWSTSNATVATVDAGHVSAQAAGSAIVTVTSLADPTKSASTGIFVTDEPSIISVTIEPGADHAMVVGESVVLLAVTVGTGEVDTSVTWSSSNDDVALVSQGIVTATSAGATTISATSVFDGSRSASIGVTVTVAPAVQGVAIAGPSARTVETGGTLVLEAEVSTVGTIDDSVSWTATCGVIQGSGASITYLAPAARTTCSVQATSVADPSVHAVVSVEVTARPSGELLWIREFGALDSVETGLHVAVGPEGSVLFGGTTDGDPWAFNGGGLAAVVGELDATGATAWLHQYGGENAYRPLAVAIASDGTRLAGGATPQGLFTRNVDALGAALAWESFGNEVLGQNATAMTIASDRSVVVAGTGETGLGLIDPEPDPMTWRHPFVLRLGTDRVPDWLGRLQGGSEMTESVHAVAVDAQDRVHVVGSRYRGQIYVAQLASSGSQAWFDPLYFEFESYYKSVYDVAPDSNGRTLSVGQWDPPNAFAPPRGFLAVHPADGAPPSVTVVGPAEFTAATAVAAAPDGSIVVAGTTTGVFGEATGSSSEPAAFLVKYGPDGAVVWIRSIASGSAVGIADVAIGADGSTTVVGTVDGQILVARYGR